MNAKTTHFIIGCGYLGKQLLTLLGNQICFFTTRSPPSNPHSIFIDINNRDSWDNLRVLSEEQGLVIYFMVPPSQIDLKIFPEFLKKLSKLKIQRCVLVSSTVVYGNSDRVVDADSKVEIDNERAQRQYQIEQEWIVNLNNAFIVRLAGIYGPKRIIGKTQIMQSEAIKGDPDGWLNLIHVDDAANLLKRGCELEQPEQIELGCDGTPIKRKEYYNFLAKQLNQDSANFSQNVTSRGTGRRCDNKITIERTGWQPQYTDFRQALVKLINI